MTGESTLRGRVMAIGGLKEKLLAAMRHGIAEVAIPVENEKDLVEVPALVKRRLRIVPVRTADEVIALALAPAAPAAPAKKPAAAKPPPRGQKPTRRKAS
jgi:ATP-dependent Lon protease